MWRPNDADRTPARRSSDEKPTVSISARQFLNKHNGRQSGKLQSGSPTRTRSMRPYSQTTSSTSSTNCTTARPASSPSCEQATSHSARSSTESRDRNLPTALTAKAAYEKRSTTTASPAQPTRERGTNYKQSWDATHPPFSFLSERGLYSPTYCDTLATPNISTRHSGKSALTTASNLSRRNPRKDLSGKIRVVYIPSTGSSAHPGSLVCLLCSDPRRTSLVGPEAIPVVHRSRGPRRVLVCY